MITGNRGFSFHAQAVGIILTGPYTVFVHDKTEISSVNPPSSKINAALAANGAVRAVLAEKRPGMNRGAL